MDHDIADILETKSEPRDRPLSIPLTKSEFEKYRAVSELVRKATGRHALPKCAGRKLMQFVDEMEKWALEKLKNKTA